VNTVVNHDGELLGMKTDGLGILAAAKEVISLAGQEIVILGAGAICRELVFLLQDESNAQVRVYNRSESEFVRNGLVEFCGSLKEFTRDASGTILVNATPLGSGSEDTRSVFPTELIDRFDAVVDLTYLPRTTWLQSEASRLGKRVVSGMRVFAHQGKLQQSSYLRLDQVDVDTIFGLLATEFG